MRFFLSCCFCLLATLASADAVEHAMALPIKSVVQKKVQELPTRTYIATPFASATISEAANASNWQNLAVEKIELVYTRYRLSPTFQQPALNRTRLENLKALCPDWFSDPSIEWVVTEQTGCSSPAEGQGYFHGFVVTHRAPATAESIEAEIASLEALVQKLNATPDPTNELLTATEEVTEVKSRWDDVRGFVQDTIRSTRKIKVPHLTADSLLFGVLLRNPWDSILLVVDVTNSMSPYTAQVLNWIKMDLKAGRTLHYTFFNDGNGKADNRKVVGATGGIHHSDERMVDPLFATMARAMRKCTRNDLPENDIEAILAGMEACPDCKTIVLVADNYSKMRDFELRSQISKPVHIIPCGIKTSVNMQYLQLARNTGGSIHLLDMDVTDLADMQEGEIRQISGVTYGVANGKLVVLAW